VKPHQVRSPVRQKPCDAPPLSILGSTASFQDSDRCDQPLRAAGRAASKRYSPDNPDLLRKTLQCDDPGVIEGALAAIEPQTAQLLKDRLLPLLKDAAAVTKQSKAKKQLEEAIRFLGG
jgi:hypothetical protein